MPDFKWDQRSGRFRAKGGRFVSESTVRDSLDQIHLGMQVRISDATARMQTQGLTVAAWEREVRQVLKDGHLAAAALAHGGWDSLDRDVQAKVQAGLRRQYTYLAAFRDEISQQDDEARQGTGNMARAALYAGSARATYHEIRRADMTERGVDQERNVLGSVVSEHCGECPALTDRKWVPVGSLPLVGERACLGNCHCHVEYRKQPARRRTQETKTMSVTREHAA